MPCVFVVGLLLWGWLRGRLSGLWWWIEGRGYRRNSLLMGRLGHCFCCHCCGSEGVGWMV